MGRPLARFALARSRWGEPRRYRVTQSGVARTTVATSSLPVTTTDTSRATSMLLEARSTVAPSVTFPSMTDTPLSERTMPPSMSGLVRSVTETTQSTESTKASSLSPFSGDVTGFGGFGACLGCPTPAPITRDYGNRARASTIAADGLKETPAPTPPTSSQLALDRILEAVFKADVPPMGGNPAKRSVSLTDRKDAL